VPAPLFGTYTSGCSPASLPTTRPAIVDA